MEVLLVSVRERDCESDCVDVTQVPDLSAKPGPHDAMRHSCSLFSTYEAAFGSLQGTHPKVSTPSRSWGPHLTAQTLSVCDTVSRVFETVSPSSVLDTVRTKLCMNLSGLSLR